MQHANLASVGHSCSCHGGPPPADGAAADGGLITLNPSVFILNGSVHVCTLRRLQSIKTMKSRSRFLSQLRVTMHRRLEAALQQIRGSKAVDPQSCRVTDSMNVVKQAPHAHCAIHNVLPSGRGGERESWRSLVTLGRPSHE